MRFSNRVVLSCVVLLIVYGELCTACSRRRPPQVLDRTPPTLSGCPKNLHYDTDPRNLYATKVTWTEPTAWDTRDGIVGAQRIEGQGPGQVFYAGVHEIRYLAKDSSGNTVSCGFNVTVVAKYCRPWATVSNGWVSCDQTGDMLVGTVCKFGCHPGYLMQGSDTTICQAHDRWSVSSHPACVPRTCGRLVPINMYTAIDCTDGDNFQSVCQYTCTNGFDILPGHTRVRTCDANGIWSGLKTFCGDVTPPKYTACPSQLVFYAERSNDFTTVYWQPPVHSDNAYLAGTVSRQVGGPRPGTAVQVGEYTVVYQAWDSENNTATCEINLTVKQITCHSLYPRPYTKVTCPDGRRFGSQCWFECQAGAALKGESTVHCEGFNSSNVWYGQWTFGSSQPFCELKEKCIRPSPPEHGALSCDTWAGGAYCVLQCQQGYVVQDSEFEPLLMCSDIRGEFSGLEAEGKLPQCAEWKSDDSFFNYKLKEYYYYFDGDCWAAKEQIKENFIKAFLANLGNLCSATNCNASYAEVDCFNETLHARERRLVASTLSVSVVLTVAEEGENKLSPTEAIMMQERIYQARVDSNASLDIGQGMSLQLTSIQVSNPEVTCPLGSYADTFRLSCVHCSRGTFHDIDSGQCRPCPRGQYQSISRQTTCLECPVGTSTRDVASVDADQCVEACPPGYMSPTGTIPCSPCDVGTYSPVYGRSECTPCPGSKTTRANVVATTLEECYEFDLEFSSDTFSGGNATLLFAPTTNCTSLYMAFWLKCSTCDRILEITDAHEQPVLSVESRDGFVDITFRRCQTSVKSYGLLESPRWHHVGLSVTDSNVTVTVDGTELHSPHTCAFVTLLESENYQLFIGGLWFIGSMTSLHLWDTTSNGVELSSVPRCSDDHLGNLVAWKQFQEVDGPFIRAVSLCDDVDNCKNAPCENEGTCLDGRDAFTCTCRNAYTGDRCEVNIDDCVGNSCQNGATCVDGEASYTCQCSSKFKGMYCETQIVDGSWTSWGMWGPCSVTCDSGKQFRVRHCSNPEPENGGANCTGDDFEFQICTMPDPCVYECETDPPNPLYGSINCSWVGDTTRQCHPFCDEGYEFDSDLFLENIVCGPDTGNMWNIRNEQNPDVQIGTCSEIQLAEGNTMVYSGEYEDLTPEVAARSQTDVPAVIQSTVKAQVDGLHCVQNQSCRVRLLEVTGVKTGTSDIRRRRNVELLGFKVEMSCTPTKDPRSCYNKLEEAYYTLQRLVNETQFSILVDQIRYDIVINGTVVQGEVSCPPGTVEMDYFCVQCGPGSYPVDYYCERCPRGTFKEDFTSPECAPCPPDWTTQGLQTRNASMCNVPLSRGLETTKAWILAVIISSVVAMILLIETVLYIYLRRVENARRHLNSQRNSQGNIQGNTTDNMYLPHVAETVM